jgi:hypothetical protein
MEYEESELTLLCFNEIFIIMWYAKGNDRFCGLVLRVPGYRSRGPGLIPGTTRFYDKSSGTGSTQPREYN